MLKIKLINLIKMMKAVAVVRRMKLLSWRSDSRRNRKKKIKRDGWSRQERSILSTREISMKKMDSKGLLNFRSRKVEFKMMNKKKRKKRRVSKKNSPMLIQNLGIWWVIQLGSKRFLSWAKRRMIIGRKPWRNFKI